MTKNRPIGLMEKGNITKLKIVQCAAPIFNQRGYAGASMADVMQATGLQKGGI
jgi:AcrR family transcriptional regulator